MKEAEKWCSENCDPLAIVCAAVVVIYIGLANPDNTPAFFSTVAFKVIIFAVVAVVTAMDTKIGVIFGLAMALSVSYSYMKSSREMFVDHEEEEDAVAMNDVPDEMGMGNMENSPDVDANAEAEAEAEAEADIEADTMAMANANNANANANAEAGADSYADSTSPENFIGSNNFAPYHAM